MACSSRGALSFINIFSTIDLEAHSNPYKHQTYISKRSATYLQQAIWLGIYHTPYGAVRCWVCFPTAKFYTGPAAKRGATF